MHVTRDLVSDQACENCSVQTCVFSYTTESSQCSGTWFCSKCNFCLHYFEFKVTANAMAGGPLSRLCATEALDRVLNWSGSESYDDDDLLSSDEEGELDG